MAEDVKSGIGDQAGNLIKKGADGILGASGLGTAVGVIDTIIQKAGLGTPVKNLVDKLKDEAQELASETKRPTVPGMSEEDATRAAVAGRQAGMALNDAATRGEKPADPEEPGFFGKFRKLLGIKGSNNAPVEQRPAHANEAWVRQIQEGAAEEKARISHMAEERKTVVSSAPAAPAAPASAPPAAAAPAAAAPAAPAAPAKATPKPLSPEEQVINEVRSFGGKLKVHMEGASDPSILKAAFEEVKRDYEVRKLRNKNSPEDDQKLAALQRLGQDQKTLVAHLTPTAP